ncbi:MAG: glutamine amidotransferase [Spirulinaceae cyanobacterium RM2_2_10]|nr:glutamine amidotransferase [Spirulinaceae cyanobacterium SM2_1_0]NJO19361.1 glutamine amidotransferase [Spirulinaceae cyanobacterium RM2_2_10]
MDHSVRPLVLLITHQATSDPGQVGELLRAKGLGLETRCPAIGDPLPTDLHPYAGVVVFGGPMSSNDEHLDFIRAELAWIPRVLAAERPFLGICLGAQLLARVLGARVAPHPEGMTEIGYFPVRFDARAEAEPPHAVFQWHKEGFELPVGAVQLAAGETFLNQAFQYGDRTVGLQFHPEVTVAILERWTTVAAEALRWPGAQPREDLFRHYANHHRSGRAWTNRFLDRWLAA